MRLRYRRSKCSIRGVVACSALGACILCQTVMACSCLRRTPAEQLTVSRAVFRGEVIRIDALANETDLLTFAVRTLWKGPISETLEVVNHKRDIAFCGGVIRPSNGDDLLVFTNSPAGETDGQLTMGVCNRTVPYNAGDASELGEPIWSEGQPLPVPFQRGDANVDSVVNISDAVRILGALFLGEGPLLCSDSADSNDDGVLDLSDAVATLEYLFLGGEDLPDPIPGSCGLDPTADELRCLGYSTCP